MVLNRSVGVELSRRRGADRPLKERRARARVSGTCACGPRRRARTSNARARRRRRTPASTTIVAHARDGRARSPTAAGACARALLLGDSRRRRSDGWRDAGFGGGDDRRPRRALQQAAAMLIGAPKTSSRRRYPHDGDEQYFAAGSVEDYPPVTGYLQGFGLIRWCSAGGTLNLVGASGSDWGGRTRGHWGRRDGSRTLPQ